MCDDELSSVFEGLEREAVGALSEQDVGESAPVIERFIEGCYVGQTWETTARAPIGRFDPEKREELARGFHATHERLWAFRAEDLPIVILNVRMLVRARRVRPQLRDIPKGKGMPSRNAELFKAEVSLERGGRSERISFYARSALCVGDIVGGPAGMVEPATTTILLDNDEAMIDAFGNIWIKK